MLRRLHLPRVATSIHSPIIYRLPSETPNQRNESPWPDRFVDNGFASDQIPFDFINDDRPRLGQIVFHHFSCNGSWKLRLPYSDPLPLIHERDQRIVPRNLPEI